MNREKLKELLERKTREYNRRSFIATDPISVPHRFSKQQDIEIAGFFASIFAWGNRTTIKQKAGELMLLMDDAPHDFIKNHQENDLKRFLSFKHRTFNPTDALYFIAFLSKHYQTNSSLQDAFTIDHSINDESMEKALVNFYNYFFSLEDVPQRTRKHIATPERGSTCKRLNMFLRWMVRKDTHGVDFGLWKKISPAQLILPIDLHSGKVARRLKLIRRKQTDWLAAKELTATLRTFDPKDPAKYDFALFGLGALNPLTKSHGK